jgi:hypothetical protein
MHFRSFTRRHIAKRSRHEPCKTPDEENIMSVSNQTPRPEPEPHEDSEQQAERYREQMKHQGIDEAVFERKANTPRNVDVEHAHQVPDEDWETGETDPDETEPDEVR